MIGPDWSELAERCQKPDHRRIGNWFARRVSRPLALRVTWVLLPTGISAHGMTCLAWLVALAATAMFALGTSSGWLAGAIGLQLWYLLDHVDGQLARYRGTASLDGVQLDYTMHHTVNLLLPLGIGYGLLQQHGQAIWLLDGVAWGLGLLLLGIEHDVRAKAFIQRLKRLEGELRVVGGGGGRPVPPASPPREPRRLLAWLLRKACEMHVIMNLLTLLALARSLLAVPEWVALGYVGLMGPVALSVAVATLVRNVRREAAEQEFARWYRPPVGQTLLEEQGWWNVVSVDENRA
jgi:CDP-alcohol phosphatidyltransferase-like enzyme